MRVGRGAAYIDRMERVISLVRRHGLDVLIVAAAIEAAIEIAVSDDSPRAAQSPMWFALPAAVVVVLPLLARRRFPFAAPAALWLLAALLSFVDGRLIVSASGIYVAGTVAAFLLGSLRDVVQARVGLGIVVLSAVIVVYNDPLHTAGEFAFIPLFFLVAWLAGFAVRERAEQAEAAEERAAAAEHERETAARIAVAEERARIARELHDVVAHAVSVMVLQVGAVRHGLPETLEEDRAALGRVEQAGRTALAEMRRLLGAMRSGDDELELSPQPGLDGLESLVADVERAGLPVRLRIDGDRVALPRAIDLSAYRIVQEGLTNALKHAQAGSAEVDVRYTTEELRIEVRDDGRGGSTNDGLGHGLVGIRERVKIYGGDMTAGASPQGGFVLTARLPLGGEGR
jgi:signal transduction histidine kinase